MNLSAEVRQQHLRNERRLQILRNGINMIFHKGENLNFPFFQFDGQYAYLLKQWIDDRYALNIYSLKQLDQVFKIEKDSCYIVQKRLFLKDRRVDYVLTNNCQYMLAKNNATILILTTALQKAYMIDEKLDNFINDSTVIEIPQNILFQIEQWAYHGLNRSQQTAIRLAVEQKIAFIKGPPGCGKTRTIARLATIFSYHGYPMMIGAVTNTANMTILNAILKQNYEMNFFPNIVLFINKQLYADNILHPPQIRAVTYRYKLVQNFLKLNEKQDLNQSQVQHLLDGYWNGLNTSHAFISVCWQAMAKIFEEAHILIITTTSALNFDYKLTEQQKFRPYIGILDEAAQASWADTYCFLIRGVEKMIFIGDDKQLTPTVISQNQILKQTIFNTHFMKNKKYYALLNQQYRMHPAISEFPNTYFYNNQLLNGVTIDERKSQFQHFKKYPVSFIHSPYSQIQEIEPKSGKKNYWNYEQIRIIVKILSFFPKEQFINIGIISPYDLQIKMITHFVGSQSLQHGLTVRTCDGYQGSQKQYIILSCVRSNKQGKIGFCSEENRLNVSITRAKKGLILIGNKDTFLSDTQQSNVWHKYLSYLKQKNLIFPQKQLNNYPYFQHSYNLPYYEQYYKQVVKQESKIAQKIQNQHNKVQNEQQNNQYNKFQSLQLQIIKQQQQETQIIFKIYKQMKKILKNLMNRFKSKLNQIQKYNNQVSALQAQKQIEQLILKGDNIIRTYVYNLITEDYNSRKAKNVKDGENDKQIHKKIKLTDKQLQQYMNCKQQIIQKQKQVQNHFKSMATKLQYQNLKILKQMKQYKQFNHLQQNKIIQKCIDLSVFWALHQNYY